MEKIIAIPEGVIAEAKDTRVTVRGEKGELTMDFAGCRDVAIEADGNAVKVKTSNEKRKTKAVAGTIIAHINNMVRGVKYGFKYTLKILYTHFPVTVEIKDSKILIKNFFGAKGMRMADIVGDTKVDVQKEDITVTGINLEEVSQTAANIEKACRVTKRDRRIFQDGIYISGKFLQTGEEL